MLSAVEGHFISGYGDAEDDPRKPLELKSEAIEEAAAKLHDQPVTAERFARVARGIAGFESTYGMELLATVYWVVSREKATSHGLVIAAVHAWSERKRMFSADHIYIACKALHERGWIPSSTVNDCL